MTESAALHEADLGKDAVVEPDGRGTLQIADKVVERIAAHTAALVDGVVEIGSGLDKLVGRRLPKASGDVHGDRVRVSVDIAVQWPFDVADVAREVRREVAAAIAGLAGMRVLGVDVSVSRIERQVVARQGRVQ